jgi:uncharacterized protein YndB with AHSA1/START domain
MSAKNNPTETSDREIVISRVVNAPRELVWEAWIDPKQVVKWWGPRGFTTTVHEMEVKPGGVWTLTMRGPDGTEYPNKSIFKEVVKPERIVFSHGGAKKGGPGANFIATWTFEAEGNKTKVTIRMVFDTAADRDLVVKTYGAIEGGQQTLGRLNELMETPEMLTEPFVITREFDAPRELVWKAWTERERLMEWFGPKGVKLTAASLDFRPGGSFHYGMRMPDGKEIWGKFVYREIVAPERIVLVNSFSDAKGGVTRHPWSATWPLEMLTTTTFAEIAPGKTKLTIVWSPLNATETERKTFTEGRPSMTQGWGGTFEQLADYLKKAGK